jgi:hypothetical protein
MLELKLCLWKLLNDHAETAVLHAIAVSVIQLSSFIIVRNHISKMVIFIKRWI